MSLLVISNILGHFVNTLTANDKYSLSNNENLPQPSQMQLSKKQIIFAEFFSPFLKFISIIEQFETKDYPHTLHITKYKECKKRALTNV